MKTLWLFGAGASYAEKEGSKFSLPKSIEVICRILKLKNRQTFSSYYHPISKKELCKYIQKNSLDYRDFEGIYDYARTHSYLENIEYDRNGAKYPNSRVADTILLGLYHILKTTQRIDYPLNLHKKFLTGIYVEGDTIVSTNYDIILDRVILKKYKQINYGLQDDMVKSYENRKIHNSCAKIKLIKLHGAFNWTVGLNKPKNIHRKMRILGSPPKSPSVKKQYISISRKFVKPSKTTQLYINPGKMKENDISNQPIFSTLIEEFKKEIYKCDQIVIIGSSVMRCDTHDNYLRKIIIDSGKNYCVIRDFKKWLQITEKE